jgi:hypothetical protein
MQNLEIGRILNLDSKKKKRILNLLAVKKDRYTPHLPPANTDAAPQDYSALFPSSVTDSTLQGLLLHGTGIEL